MDGCGVPAALVGVCTLCVRETPPPAGGCRVCLGIFSRRFGVRVTPEVRSCFGSVFAETGPVLWSICPLNCVYMCVELFDRMVHCTA